MIILCPNCKTKFNIKGENISEKKFRCSRCGTIFSNITESEKLLPLILVAHDDYRVVNIIKKVLQTVPSRILVAYDGNEAYKIIVSKKPDLAIIDVALQGLFGFELCEKVKKKPELINTKIILVASIYDRTRYKRKPQNLYGADDYIEKHHIPDTLLDKVIALIPQKVASENKLISEKSKTEFHIEDQIKDNRDLLLEKTRYILKERDEICKHERDSLAAIPEITKRAKKLAHLIVSDIALYNQEVIEDLDMQNFKNLLKLDFDDGVKYLGQKIPDIKDMAEQILEEAFLDLINKRKVTKNE